jgi:SAM-dependent methyltransferase
MSHSVKDHLGLAATEYDRTIRTFVPDYDPLLDELLRWLAPIGAAGGRVIDLGCGTGSLSAAIAERFPEVSIECWDVDAKMLGEAGRRLAPYGARVSLRERSFFEPLPACDAVVASLSLHHVRELAEKQRLYGAVHAALRPNGVFLNADVTMSTNAAVKDETMRRWVDFMGTHGISRVDAKAHLAAWADEDRYYSLDEELRALAAAGFAPPECFWRRGPMTLYGGSKSSSAA